MEINRGRITPTTKTETIAFASFLRNQNRECYKDIYVPELEIGKSLSIGDSYGLFCAMGRCAYGSGELMNRPVILRVAKRSLQKMAQHSVDRYQEEIDGFDPMVDEISNVVVRLAGKTVTPTLLSDKSSRHGGKR